MRASEISKKNFFFANTSKDYEKSEIVLILQPK